MFTLYEYVTDYAATKDPRNSYGRLQRELDALDEATLKAQVISA
jgi:hypothetical protein